MAQSQEIQAKAADQHPKSIEGKYKIDDKVWLSTKNIKTKQPLKKLDHKMIGPYKVKKLVELLYQLKLSTSMKIYDVFYPSLLQKASANPFPSQRNDPAAPIIVNNKKEWEVNDILDTKRKGKSRKVQFRVKWKRYNKNKTWYNASEFEHSKELVDNFYQRNPTKPR